MYKPIEVIAHFDKSGKLIPYRLKYEDAKQMNHVIRIDKIIKQNSSTHNGNIMRVFRCSVTNKDAQKEITLYYEVEKCLWYVGVR